MFKKLLMALVLATAGLATTVPASASFYSGGDWYGQNLTLADGDQLSGEFFNIGLLTLPTGATVNGIGSLLRLNASQININGNLWGNQNQPGQLYLNSTSNVILSGALAYWTTIDISAGSYVYLGEQSQIPTELPISAGAVSSISIGTGNSASVLAGGSVSLWTGQAGSTLTDGSISIGAGWASSDSTLSGGTISLRTGVPSALVIGSPLIILQPGDITLLPTPVPAAALLFCSGLGGLALLRRRSGLPG